MNVANLFARIGIKTNVGPLKSFQKQLDTVKKTFGGLSIVSGAYTYVMSKIVAQALNGAAAFQQFEAETGASAQELQRWQAVANQTNNSGEALAQSIRAIASNREAIRMGGGNISTYQLLGIDPNQDPFQVLEQLREKTDGMSEAMRRNILAGAGVSSELVRVLDLTNEEFDRMASRAFIVSPGAIQQLDKARGAMQIAGNAFNYIKTQIAAGLAPQIEKLSYMFADFVKNNEADIVKFFQEGSRLVQSFTKAIFDVIGMIDRFVQSSIGWRAAIMVIIGVFVALNSAVMLPIAGILLLIALIQDIAYYQQGKKSLIGTLFEQFPALEEMFMRLAGPGTIIGEVFNFIAESITTMANAVERLMQGDFESFMDQMSNSGNAFWAMAGGISDLASGEKTFGETLRGAFDWVRTNSPAARVIQGVTGNRNNNVNINAEINIDGSQNPVASGNAAARELQQMATEYSNGVE